MFNQQFVYLVLAVLCVLIGFASVEAQKGCLHLEGPAGRSGSVSWKVLSDRLDVTATYPREKLDAGWLAIGFSENIAAGMAGADILFMYKNETGFEIAEKKAVRNSRPPPANSTLFEVDSVQINVVGSNVVVQFSKKLEYSGGQAVKIIDGDLALLVAFNDVATPTSPVSFSRHTWTQKEVVNFLNPVNTCPIVPDASPSPVTQPSESTNVAASESKAATTSTDFKEDSASSAMIKNVSFALLAGLLVIALLCYKM